MVAARRIRWSLVLLLVAGCSKESLLRGALADPADRKETMELTLKICDEHPEYVDDLFALARGHAPTFDRLVQQTAAALEDPAFSTDVAGKLATHTKAVQIVTEALLATARNAPELRRALGAASVAESDVIQQIAAENPQLVQQVMARMFASPPAPH